MNSGMVQVVDGFSPQTQSLEKRTLGDFFFSETEVLRRSLSITCWKGSVLQMQVEESGNGSRTQDHGYKFKTGNSLNVHLTIVRSKKLVLLMELRQASVGIGQTSLQISS